jgi:hypothetical protein
MKDLIPGIFSVYQLEQEFYPYLSVEFIPNTKYAAGVLIVVGDKVIRRNYTFNDPNDIVELRKLIWKYVREIDNPSDIAITRPDGEVCIKDFNKGGGFKVIQGWNNKLKSLEKNVCCKGATSETKDVPMDQQLINHEVYRYSNKDQINLPICKKLRFQECADNYPPNTPTYKRCLREANWVCENGYPCNIRTELIATYREKLKNDILRYLKRNDMRVDKPMFDLIMSAGFFERPNNRVGNKASPYIPIIHTTDSIMIDDYDYYSKMIEGMTDGVTRDQNCNKTHIILLILIIIVIMTIIYLTVQP